MGVNTISVIIPVFNSEKSLPRCLDSLRAQTYQKWEALLIDDGSTDESLRICKEYASKDQRFRVFHQENSGVSIARQVGLNHISGDYVISVDSDDWIEPEMYEKMMLAIKEDNCDVVICNFFFHKGNQVFVFPQEFPLQDDSEATAEAILLDRMHGSLWNKLISVSAIRKYHCSFVPHIDYCEDVLFLCSLFRYHLKVSYLQSALYHYISHEGQLTMNFDKKYFKVSYIGYARKLVELYPSGPLHDGANYRLAQVLWKFYYKMDYSRVEKKEILHGMFRDVLFNKYIAISNKVRFVLAMLGIKLPKLC